MAAHIAIQIGPFEKKDPVPLACAICLIKTMTDPRPAMPGKMRCELHSLQCGTCYGAVVSDAHFCCQSCWTLDRTNRMMPEQILLRSAAPCPHKAAKKVCGCFQCAEKTTEFFKARSLEEGEVARNTPPASPGSDETVISF